MASVTETPPPSVPPPPPAAAAAADQQLVDREIGRTRRALKLVDLTAGLITLLIGVMSFLLVAAILEHWVVPGGWGDTARTVLFATLLLGIGWYAWRTFWPLLGQSINPAYAAQTIEQTSPSLKNSLLNLLLLRNSKRQLPSQVYQAIEQQAAQRLSQVRLDAVVDRSAIVRLGYVLVALTAVCVLYRFLSPKDLFASTVRVVLPWSNIATPSRVEILDIKPGDTKAARGEQLTVSAEVLGLDEEEPVRLYYTTADEQVVGQEIKMTASAGGARFECQVPGRIGGGSGIEQDFTYWIEAGDARSPKYEVAVFSRPTLVVNRLRYEFPAYTGYPSREVENTGDISAVEGTVVTLFAQANQPIKTAHVDFEADGRRDLLMNASELQANVSFPLTLRDDRRTPRYQSYALRYTTVDDHQNANPPKYKIDVQPDYSPEIQLLLPEEETLEVALNQEVNFELEARDLDFALRQVYLLGSVGEEQVLKHELLNKFHTGRFVGKLRTTPSEMGLKVGDEMEYWGAATDNRRPEANLAFSAHRKLRIIGPWQGDQQGKPGEQGEGDQQQGEGGKPQEGEGKQEGQAGGGEQGNSGEGEQGAEGQQGQGQESGEPNADSEQQGQGGSGQAGDNQQNGDNQESQNGESGNSPSDGSENSNSSNAGDQSGDPSANQPEGQSGGDSDKVSAEGDDDGNAFERMMEHFKQQDGQNGQQQADAQAGEGAERDPQASADNNAAEGSPEGNQSSAGDAAEQQSGDQSAGQEGLSQQQQSPDQGAGGEPAPSEQENANGNDDPQGEQGESPDGQMSSEQGNAGQGGNNDKEQGVPNPDEQKNPQDKQGNANDNAERHGSEASSQARDQSESDSQGAQGGDHSGGGQEGGGQQADAEGKGGAGTHKAADEGGGQASESGEGDTGNRPGEKQQAEGKTGESSGDQPGGGSQQGDQAGTEQGGNQEGGESAAEGKNEANSGEQDPGQKPQDANRQPPNEQPPQQSQSSSSQGQDGQPSGTGGSSSVPPPDGELQPGDQANLDYARKQTDLVLERLEDQLQKKQVDKNLLEKLGWTQEELRRFVDRWKGLKDNANQPDAADANSELVDALRSLGLNRNQRTGYNAKLTPDQLRDLQEGYRGKVPLEFQEQVRSYLKGTAAAEENE